MDPSYIRNLLNYFEDQGIEIPPPSFFENEEDDEDYEEETEEDTEEEEEFDYSDEDNESLISNAAVMLESVNIDENIIDSAAAMPLFEAMNVGVQAVNNVDDVNVEAESENSIQIRNNNDSKESGIASLKCDDNGEENNKSHMNRGEIDGLFCPICFEAWASRSDHQVCCLPCGHIYGLSCIKKWLKRSDSSKCPQCKKECKIKDVRLLYATQIVAVDGELQKKVRSLEAKCATIEKKTAKKEVEWKKREADLCKQLQSLLEFFNITIGECICIAVCYPVLPGWVIQKSDCLTLQMHFKEGGESSLPLLIEKMKKMMAELKREGEERQQTREQQLQQIMEQQQMMEIQQMMEQQPVTIRQQRTRRPQAPRRSSIQEVPPVQPDIPHEQPPYWMVDFVRYSTDCHNYTRAMMIHYLQLNNPSFPPPTYPPWAYAEHSASVHAEEQHFDEGGTNDVNEEAIFDEGNTNGQEDEE